MFIMKVHTNFNGKLFKQNSQHKSNSIPAEIFHRWAKNNLITVVPDVKVETVKVEAVKPAEVETVLINKKVKKPKKEKVVEPELKKKKTYRRKKSDN